jgi:hypothetical protein
MGNLRQDNDEVGPRFEPDISQTGALPLEQTCSISRPVCVRLIDN